MMMKRFILPLIAIFMVTASLRAQSCDPWIINAYKQLYQRNPTAEECNFRNYNNGSWSNYDELVRYIRSYNDKKKQAQAPAAASCDAWIINAYKQLYNRNPTAEECNIRNYNNGSWTGYDQLVGYIRSYNERKQQASAPVAPSCDAWIMNAYKQLYHRNPTAEECNIRNYNNGSWTSYDQLVGYIKNYNSKKTARPINAVVKGDPWIIKAYGELYRRRPNAWEVIVQNYNNGSWSNYNELKGYIRDYQNSMKRRNVLTNAVFITDTTSIITFIVDGKPLAVNLVRNDGLGVVAAGGDNVIAAGGDNLIKTDGGYVISPGGGNVVSPGGGNVISPGGGNVISPGGGNVISPGGGNVISPGGANLIFSGMAGVSFGGLYSTQAAGTLIVPASGKTALIFK